MKTFCQYLLPIYPKLVTVASVVADAIIITALTGM
jgi:hypothetical protein